MLIGTKPRPPEPGIHPERCGSDRSAFAPDCALGGSDFRLSFDRLALRSALAVAPDRLLALPAILQLAFWLTLIVLIKADSLFEPPVWDSAMGVFPPAVFLYESGFDIRALLQQGNWWMGGPNVHSLSLFTWFVALVMTLTHSAPATFAIVHATTFVMVAGALVLFSRALRRDGLPGHAVLTTTAFVLSLPLVLVQVGYLYTESWVMVLSIAAWAAWRDTRIGLAVLACALVIFVKLTGIAIVICVGLALLLDGRTRIARKLALLATLAVAILVTKWLPGWLDAAQVPGPSWGDPDQLARSFVERLSTIPDVTFWLLVGMLSTALYGGVCLRRGARLRDLLSIDGPQGARLICLLMPFAFSAGIAASIFSQILFLPRYLIPALPFAAASMLYFAASIGGTRWLSGVLIAACVANGLNWSGRLYPPEYASFSIVERSHAYRDFLHAEIDLIRAMERAPATIPIFVSKEIGYMTSDPMMGYVDRELPQIRPIYRPPYSGRPLDEYPDEFMLAYSNPGHGGEEIARLVQLAAADPGFGVRSLSFERNGFRTALFWIRRNGLDQTAGHDAIQPSNRDPLPTD
jgi:hypothetical protein